MLSRPATGADVVFRDWRLIETEYLVIGRVILNGGQLSVEYELFDVFGQASLLSSAFLAPLSNCGISHFISIASLKS